MVGWKRIADYLGQPIAAVQRWATLDGMPVYREGRYVEASPEGLNRWLGRESASKQPVHIPHGEEEDLAAELKRPSQCAKAKATNRLGVAALNYFWDWAQLASSDRR